jgi:hypothetical protein
MANEAAKQVLGQKQHFAEKPFLLKMHEEYRLQEQAIRFSVARNRRKEQADRSNLTGED